MFFELKNTEKRFDVEGRILFCDFLNKKFLDEKHNRTGNK